MHTPALNLVFLSCLLAPESPSLDGGPGGPLFPLRPSPSGRYLVDARGEPFFYQGDAAWQLAKMLTREEVEAYLEARKSLGFTAVQVQAVAREVGPVANRAGDEPFQPADDILKPQESYWRQVDFVLEAAERRGLLVGFAPLWLRWGGSDREGWRYQLTDQNARPYGLWLGERYRRFQNIVWILVGDSNPIDRTRAVAEVARAIKEKAPHQLITAHNRPGYSSSAFFETQDWLDVNMAYTYEEVYPHVLGEWNRLGKPRPIVLGESGYEEEGNDGRGGAPWRCRRQAYEAVLAGALGGHCFGQKHLWRFDDEWRRALGSPASKQMAQVRKLFATRPWHELVPDQEHELVITGREQFGKLEYVTAARAAGGGFAFAYFPVRRTVTVDLERLTGPVTARWFDPTDGGFQELEGSPFANGGRRDFTSPEKNRDGDGDFVLVLEGSKR